MPCPLCPLFQPLHYAADAVGQIAGLVNVFAAPPAGVTPIVAMRTTPSINMAADHSQVGLVRCACAGIRGFPLLLPYVDHIVTVY